MSGGGGCSGGPWLMQGGDDGVDAIFVWCCWDYDRLGCFEAIASHRIVSDLMRHMHVIGTVK